MKAVICNKFGVPEVIEIREIEKPIPRNIEVLIKIRATTVTTYDCWVRGLKLSSRLISLLFGVNFGSCAEYRCMDSSDVLDFKPINMTIEEAASVQQGALTVLYYLREVNVNKNKKVLVFGASGGVDIYSVQLA
jgi:NADPH:quinone reductase-like Zn-dependent oxidoreductase